MVFHVDSEVGQLRRVIVHRPGLELSRLPPSNVEELLFDAVVWAQRAREGHDPFRQDLPHRGVPRPPHRALAHRPRATHCTRAAPRAVW